MSVNFMPWMLCRRIKIFEVGEDYWNDAFMPFYPS